MVKDDVCNCPACAESAQVMDMPLTQRCAKFVRRASQITRQRVDVMKAAASNDSEADYRGSYAVGFPASVASEPKNIRSRLASASAFWQAAHGREVE